MQKVEEEKEEQINNNLIVIVFQYLNEVAKLRKSSMILS